MQVTFICHYFHPEIGAPAARVLETAREWVKMGHEVQVVTCFPNHPTGVIPEKYRGKWSCRESLQGIEIYRSYVFATPNQGIVKRTLGHLSFMLSSLIWSLPKTGKADVIIVSSPTLFSVISAFVYSRLKKVPFVFEVRDLWPAIFVDLGIIRNRTLIRILESMEMFLYEKAAKIVVVTEAFRKDLIQREITESKVEVVTNGADTDLYNPMVDGGSIRRELGLTGEFLCMYIGAHGISHGLSSIVEAADLLAESRDLHFLFVGEGAEKEAVEALACEKKLSNITFLPGQAKERVPLFYAASDICMVPLRDVELFKGFIPSKIFEILAAGKPIVGSVRGEAYDILKDSGAALLVPPEDSAAMAEAIIRLKDDRVLVKTMGETGRRYVMENYSRQGLSRVYERILQEVV